MAERRSTKSYFEGNDLQVRNFATNRIQFKNLTINFFFSDTTSDLGNEQSLVLSVVLTLTDCPVTCNALLNEEQSLLVELCSNCLVLEHHTAACQALGILTSLVSYCYTEKISPPPDIYMEQINLHLESLIYSSLMNEKLVNELRQYLKCGIRLSEKNLEFAEEFVELIGGILTDDFGE